MLSQARQTKEDAQPVPNHSSSLLPGKLMATKEIWVHPLSNSVVFFFSVTMHSNVKTIVGILVSFCSWMHGTFRLSRHQDSWPPVLVSICLAEQVAGFFSCPDMCTVVMAF
jgi:hypothetical protein